MVTNVDMLSSGADGSAEGRIPADTLISRLPVVDDLDALATLLGWRPRLFLRQSSGPAHDLATTAAMKVISLTPEPWWSGSIVDWIALRLDCVPAPNAHDRLWLLTAEITHRGFGDELLVQTAYVRPVAWVDDSVIEAAHRRHGRR
jgi:hypothetical protein